MSLTLTAASIDRMGWGQWTLTLSMGYGGIAPKFHLIV